MIKVDIILISYNQDQYIREAVESIFTQKVNDDVQLRLIVADDFSSDNTLAIIQSIVPTLRQSSPLVKDVLYLYADSNLGINRNYQRAFAACEGDYIAIMEGDDYWTVNYHLQQHIDFLQTHPECSMSMNRITYTMNGEYKGIDGWQYKEDYKLFSIKDQIVWNNVLGNLSACVLRTSCVKRIPQKNFSVYFDDFLLGISMAEYGYLAILKESTSIYRGNDNSLWASKNYFERIIHDLKLGRLYDQLMNYQYHSYWKMNRCKYFNELRRNIRHIIVHKISGEHK